MPDLDDVSRGTVHKIRNECDVKMARFRHAYRTATSSEIVRGDNQLVDKTGARNVFEICNSTMSGVFLLITSLPMFPSSH